jgi:hypothetical protein
MAPFNSRTACWPLLLRSMDARAPGCKVKSSRPFSMMIAGADPATITSPASTGQLGIPGAFVAVPPIFTDSRLITDPTGEAAGAAGVSIAIPQTTEIESDDFCRIANFRTIIHKFCGAGKGKGMASC